MLLQLLTADTMTNLVAELLKDILAWTCNAGIQRSVVPAKDQISQEKC